MGCTTSSSATNTTDPEQGVSFTTDEETAADGGDYALLDSLHGVEIVMRRREQQHFTQNIVTENRAKDIHEFYKMDYDTVLGAGVSGTVCLGVHRRSNVQYAVKCLNKRKVKLDKLKQLQQEIRIMVQLDHPSILRLHEFYETRDVIYMVLELCQGGELLDRLHAQEGEKFPEKIACQYVYTILSAVRYCHSHDIVHRDLKLENFLFETKERDSDLKLIDFGLSQYFRPTAPGEMLTKSCGTPYYVSPEVLEGSYNLKCDVWSVGVIAYMLLSGSPPFSGKTDAETLQAVRSGRWRFNENQWRFISLPAKSFIRACLERSLNKRPSSEEALLHPWFAKLLFGNENIPLASQVLNLEIIQRMSKFNRLNSLQKLFLEVVAHTLTPEQIVPLRREFAKVDVTRSGVISIQDLRAVFDRQSGSKGDFPTLSDVEISTIFDAVDYDKSGVIYWHEYLASTIHPQNITDANLRLSFDVFSGHGAEISAHSIKELLGLDATLEDVQDMLREADVKGDISYEDFKSVMMSENIFLGGTTPQSSPLKSPYTKHRKRFAV